MPDNQPLPIFGPEGLLLSFNQDWNGKDNPQIGATSSGQGFRIQFQNGNSLQVQVARKGNLARIATRWRFAQEGGYRLYATTRLSHEQKAPEIFLPAIWYQGNRQGEGKFPSETIAENFSFLETRSSLPCAIVLAGSRNTLCQCISPAPCEPLASVSWRGDCAITTIPGAEWPYSYRGKGKLVSTQDETKPRWHFAQGTEYEREWTVMLTPSDGVLAAWECFVRALEVRPLWKPTLSWEQYGTTKLAHLLSLVRFEDGEPYLLMGSGNGEEQQVYEFTAGSFLVKGLEAATEFATTPAWMLQEPHVRERLGALMPRLGISRLEEALPLLALRLGRYYLKAERAPGIWQDCHDLESGLWGGYLGIGEHPEFRMMVNSRTTGEAMRQYVCLYEALEPYGLADGRFLEVAGRVAQFFCDIQISGGSFGRWWTTKGRPENTSGTNGAYIATFLCTLLRHKDDERLKSHLLLALEHYGRLIDDGRFYGDTLDADSCDKEAGVALLDLMLHAWNLLEDQRYLDWARKAARFVLSWTWQTDGWLEPDSPMAKRHFHTQGMTSVSIANQHLDFYGMLVALLFERLSKASGDPFWHRQAVMMENASRQLVATEADMLGRSEAYYGWQPEQMNHTDWDYFDREDQIRGTFAIDIAWVAVLGYGAWLTLQEEGYITCDESV